MSEHQVSPDVTADVKLIRAELDRCRAILDRMSTAAGRAAGEAPESFTAKQLIEEVLGDLPEHSLVATKYEGAAAGKRLLAPRTALSQALRALVQNGLDSRPGANVTIAVHANDFLEIAIGDQGSGMPEEVLARAGEPFFTTKQPGKGMGLGLFLARSVIERLGGHIAIDSQAGEGTKVTVTLPLDFRN